MVRAYSSARTYVDKSSSSRLRHAPSPGLDVARSELADVLATAVPNDRGSETLCDKVSDLAQFRGPSPAVFLSSSSV
eukprot:1306315-Prymnesium_polylepis.1